MTDPKILVLLALIGIGYMTVQKVKHPINVAATKTAHGIVHVATLGKK